LRPLGVAIWFVTLEQKVLLQQKRVGKYGIEIFQPIEAWVGTDERVEDRVKQLPKEEFGEIFVTQYLFGQFSRIKTTRFPILGQGMATRHHFLCPILFPITDQQLSVISSSGKFRLVGKEDLPKIKKLSDRQKDLKEDIVLFKEDCEILLKILGVKGE